MGILNLLKKKPKEAVMAEAIESANLARQDGETPQYCQAVAGGPFT